MPPQPLGYWNPPSVWVSVYTLSWPPLQNCLLCPLFMSSWASIPIMESSLHGVPPPLDPVSVSQLPLGTFLLMEFISNPFSLPPWTQKFHWSPVVLVQMSWPQYRPTSQTAHQTSKFSQVLTTPATAQTIPSSLKPQLLLLYTSQTLLSQSFFYFSPLKIFSLWFLCSLLSKKIS